MTTKASNVTLFHFVVFSELYSGCEHIILNDSHPLILKTKPHNGPNFLLIKISQIKNVCIVLVSDSKVNKYITITNDIRVSSYV